MFGMGTGVSPSLKPPEKLELEKNKGLLRLLNRVRAIGSAGRRVDQNIGQANRPISTGQLNASQRLHLLPINLVIFQGPSGRPHLRGGFPLRCFQRLSFPNLATQRCRWRDNWCTRGSSIPVLSY